MKPLRRDILFYASAIVVLIFALYRRKATLLTSVVLLSWYGLYVWKLIIDQRRFNALQQQLMADEGENGGAAHRVSAFRERYNQELQAASGSTSVSNSLESGGPGKLGGGAPDSRTTVDYMVKGGAGILVHSQKGRESFGTQTSASTGARSS